MYFTNTQAYYFKITEKKFNRILQGLPSFCNCHFEVDFNTVEPLLPATFELPTMTTILGFRFLYLLFRGSFEQRQPFNKGHNFWPRGWSLYTAFTVQLNL